MKTSSRFCLGIFGLALVFTTGCSSPSQTSNVPPGTLLMTPGKATEVVGKPNWIPQSDAAALVELNRKPYPADTILVALDQNHNPTAFLATTADSVVTKDTNITYQGVKVISGTLGADDQIAHPGPEFNLVGQIAINNYQAKQDASAATATPSVNDTAAKSSSSLVPSS